MKIDQKKKTHAKKTTTKNETTIGGIEINKCREEIYIDKLEVVLSIRLNLLRKDMVVRGGQGLKMGCVDPFTYGDGRGGYLHLGGLFTWIFTRWGTIYVLVDLPKGII